MADNPEMMTEFKVITQDDEEDESVIAEVVEESSKNVTGVTARTFTNQVRFATISHDTNFDVTGNRDSLENMTSDNEKFVQVTTKKRKVEISGFLVWRGKR